jgi:two-component system, LuxR family, response regulator FixJ
MVLPMATRTPRIAVVDDDPFVLRGLRRLLRSAGFDVDTYASGAAFLNAGGDDEPDCVVLDLHMPQTTGFEVQAQLVKRGRSTPVIVITGGDDLEAQSRALRLGAKGYFGKPVDGEALLATIDAAITTRRAQAGWRRP